MHEDEPMHEEPDPPPYVEVCVDRRTAVRVSYRSCDAALPGFAPRYYRIDARIPAMSEKVKNSLPKLPDDGYYHLFRAPAKGGQGKRQMIFSPADPQIEVCVSKATRIRVPDSRCTDGDPGHTWYYLELSSHVPAVGMRAAGGSFEITDGDPYRARPNGGDGVDVAIGYEYP